MTRLAMLLIVSLPAAVLGLASAQPPPKSEVQEKEASGESLTARVGTPEHKAITAIFETWNTTHTRARAAIRLQQDRFRAQKTPVPPVVHYAAALVMMQIGAHAAPDVENVHLAKVDDSLATLAKARIALREDDTTRATSLADQAVDDKHIGKLGAMMRDAVKAFDEVKGKPAAAMEQSNNPAVKLIADARTKSDEDLAEKRKEMKRLDTRHTTLQRDLTRLQQQLATIKDRTVSNPMTGFRGYYLTLFDKAAAISACERRIKETETERLQVANRHGVLKKEEADEVAKLTWRIWSARLPWNVEDERKRLLAGKSPEEYYSDKWDYKPSLPTEFPKQIPAPYTPKRGKK